MRIDTEPSAGEPARRRRGTVRITRLSPGLDRARPAAEEVRESLARRPRELPTKYLYALDGSDIFDRITRLPEYYVTRAETAALTSAVTALGQVGCWDRLLEVGAGFGRKTRILLDEL